MTNREELIRRLLDTSMTDEEVAPYLALTEEEVSELRSKLA